MIEINQYIDQKLLPPGPQLPECYPHLNLELKAGTIYYYNALLQKKQEADAFVNKLLEGMANDQDSVELPNGTTVSLPKHDWDEIQKLDETTQKLVKSQVAHILNQVAEQVKSTAGNIPGEIQNILDTINNEEPPKFDWRGYIRRFRGKSIKTYTKQSRRMYNKRMPELSGLKIKQRNHILVGLDTSGSVNMEELREFMQEIRHMYKTGSAVTIVQCDTAISNISVYRPSDEFNIHGRGGKFCATLYGDVQ
jgi:predicted metal-dependent peptidase